MQSILATKRKVNCRSKSLVVRWNKKNLEDAKKKWQEYACCKVRERGKEGAREGKIVIESEIGEVIECNAQISSIVSSYKAD